MENSFEFLKERYPAYISKEQLYRICQISKESAKWLLDNGVIPCECGGGLTRRYKIAMDDVIAYLEKRQRYGASILPPGVKKAGSMIRVEGGVRNPIHRFTDEEEGYVSADERERITGYFEDKLRDLPDLLPTETAAAVLGMSKSWINQCVKDGVLESLCAGTRNMIPKVSVMEFVSGRRYIDAVTKNRLHFLNKEFSLGIFDGMPLARRSETMSAKIISVSMEKGGVGKTTTCINIASSLVKMNQRVLIVDSDPQGDVSKALKQLDNIRDTLANLLLSILDTGENVDCGNAIITVSDYLHLIPSNRRLAGVQNRMVSEKAGEDLFNDSEKITSERILKHLLDTLRQEYDYILIDCPPSLSMLTINALVAADSVLLPVESQVLSYDDISETLATVNGVRKKYNPGLKIEGLLLTKFQGQTKLSNSILKLVRENYSEELTVFNQPIPYAVKLAEQAGYGISIHELEPFSKASMAYDMVAKELYANV